MNYNWCSISSELQQAATAGGKRLTLARLVAAIEQRLPAPYALSAHPSALEPKLVRVRIYDKNRQWICPVKFNSGDRRYRLSTLADQAAQVIERAEAQKAPAQGA